jgi:hypothetical protein
MYKLFEGLESKDLARLVIPNIHVDEFKSKMGADKDVCVLSFRVNGKEPAKDLVNFIEIGYDYVLDADVSSGELDNGDYIVFVELERNSTLSDNIIDLVTDMLNVTDQDINDWTVKYRGATSYKELTNDTLRSIIPMTPEEYERRFGKEDIDALKNAAGVDVNTKAPKNDFTEALRIAAGII